MNASLNIEKTNNVETEKMLVTISDTKMCEKDKLYIEEQINYGIKNIDDDHVLNELYTIGSNSIELSKDSYNLINKQVNAVLGDGNKSGMITTQLNSLRDTAQNISYKKLLKHTIVDKGLAIIGLNRYKSKIKTAMTKFSNTKKVMGEIIDALEQGKITLEKDVAGLLSIKDKILLQQKQIHLDIYALEMLVNKTESMESTTNINNIVEAAKINLMDLKVLSISNDQFVATIVQTCHNAKIQTQSINRVCGITVKLSVVGLIIRSVMENSKNINNACKASQEFLSTQLVSNANMFKTQTIETMEMKKSPLVCIDKLEEAHRTITEAIELSIDQTNSTNEEITKYLKRLDNITNQSVTLLSKQHKQLTLKE